MSDRRIGVVKVSKRLLEELLFQSSCKIDMMLVDTDDMQSDTLSIRVSGHDTLPFVPIGERIPLVDCQITKEYVKIAFVKR